MFMEKFKKLPVKNSVSFVSGSELYRLATAAAGEFSADIYR
jgi:hypothetical protein